MLKWILSSILKYYIGTIDSLRIKVAALCFAVCEASVLSVCVRFVLCESSLQECVPGPSVRVSVCVVDKKMPRGNQSQTDTKKSTKSKGKKGPDKTPDIVGNTPATSAETDNPEHYSSETEFEEVQESLEKSLSYESLTWMRHVIRVQAEDVLKTKLDHVIQAEVAKYIADNLAKAVHPLEVKTKELEETVAKLNRALTGVNKDLAKKNDEIEKLKSHIDRIDQKQREKVVRVTGVEEESDEKLQRKIVKIAKNKLGMKKIKEEDVQEVYRAGKKKSNKTRDIVIQFTKKSTRDVFLQHKSKIPRTADPKTRMYINEDLTEYRQKLLFDASGKIKGAWSMVT